MNMNIYIEIVRFITKTKYNNQRVFGITSASIPSLEGKLYIHSWGCLPSQLLCTLATNQSLEKNWTWLIRDVVAQKLPSVFCASENVEMHAEVACNLRK